MTNEEAIEILTKHNAWRRGDDTHEMGCVKQLGLAIDHAIEVLRGDNKLPNPSPMEMMITEFRIDKHLDAILCPYYQVSNGYFLRLQKFYDDMEEARNGK